MAEKKNRFEERGMTMREHEAPRGLIAKRAHVVHQNEHHFEIKEGDDVSHLPAHLLVPLRAEGVID